MFGCYYKVIPARRAGTNASIYIYIFFFFFFFECTVSVQHGVGLDKAQKCTSASSEFFSAQTKNGVTVS